MSGKRQPTDLVEANGKKHMTKSEKAQRKAQEVKGSGDIKQLRAPDWLDEDLRPEFNRISAQLIALMPSMIVRTDAETIAAWVTVHNQWIAAGKVLSRTLTYDIDTDAAAKWSGVQSKLFTQARALASDLGLTISARCQLVIPAAPDKAPEGNPFGGTLHLMEGGKAANG